MKNIEQNKKQTDKKKHNIKIITIGSVVITAVIVIMVSIILNNKPDTVIPQNTSVGQNIEIVKSEITGTAKFYPYKAGQTDMELLALKATDGTIRTAFNTCQICYNSGRGYYVQEGNVLVCQNCGNRYSADKVGIEKGGCNPVPIMSGDRTENDGTITISADFIAQYKDYFSRWKK
jgi:uncharacterized membrane protein